jgi:hypothetical protein
MIEQQNTTVAFTPFALDPFGAHARRDRWLHLQVDKSSTDPAKVTVDIPDDAMRFFEESLARVDTTNAWMAYVQSELRRRYAMLLARSLPRDRPPAARERRHLDLLEQDFYGALGIVEGLMLNKEGYSVGAVGSFLESAGQRMPSDAPKAHRSHFFYLRGTVRTDVRDNAGAARDFETALSIWAVANNPAIKPLEHLYRESGDRRALQAMQDRVKRLNHKL